MKTIKGRTSDEAERITQLLRDAGVAEERIAMMDPVITNVVWMRVKLDETRKVIANTSVVIPYDNGGGQTGIRENPIFKGYESLYKSYMAGMSKIIDCLPPEKEKEAVQAEAPKTVLQMVRARHGKEA